MEERYGVIKRVAVMAPWWVGLVAMFFGCATLDKSECIHADWQSIGYEDGARGYKTSYIGRHRKACAKYGVTPDFEMYEHGRQNGLLEWCTPPNGYRLGLRGKRYNGECPSDLAPDFMAAISQGRAYHQYEKEVEKQADLLEQSIEDQTVLDETIKTLEAELVRDGISPRRRMNMLQELRKLESDRRAISNEIEDMAQTLKDMQHNLERMRSNHPYRQ